MNFDCVVLVYEATLISCKLLVQNNQSKSIILEIADSEKYFVLKLLTGNTYNRKIIFSQNLGNPLDCHYTVFLNFGG